MSALAHEFVRKAFHLLALIYGAVFYFAGWPRAGWMMAGWLVVVFLIETARLRVPALERILVNFFEGMIRDTERRHFSGIIYTATGSFGAMLVAGGDQTIVAAAIGQLAFGDAAAALVGKAFGTTKIPGGAKSLEGSLACFSVCFAVALIAGVSTVPALGSAVAATVIELKSTSGLFNDNFWLPMASSTLLRVFGAI